MLVLLTTLTILTITTKLVLLIFSTMFSNNLYEIILVQPKFHTMLTLFNL